MKFIKFQKHELSERYNFCFFIARIYRIVSAIRKLHVGFTISEILIVCYWTYIKIDFLRFESIPPKKVTFGFACSVRPLPSPSCFLSGYSFCPQASREFDSESNPDIFKCAIQSRNKKKLRNESDNVWTGESGYFLFLGKFLNLERKKLWAFCNNISHRSTSGLLSTVTFQLGGGVGGGALISPLPPKKSTQSPKAWLLFKCTEIAVKTKTSKLFTSSETVVIPKIAILKPRILYLPWSTAN